MANQIQFKIEGAEGIIRQLDAIAHGRNAAERAALRGGSVPINKAARRIAVKAKDTGLLAKSIGINIKKMKGQLTARIGPRAGFRKQVTRRHTLPNGTVIDRQVMANPVNYAHFVEFGTSHSSAKPFIRTAIAETKDQIVTAMSAALEKHLIRKQARAASKAAESA